MADLGLAMVKPLADIVLKINEAVNTVQQNEKDCLRIAECAHTYCGFVESMVKGTDITQDNSLRVKLDKARITFEEALKVVKKCQERHICCHFFWAKGIADELKNVLEDLKIKMQQANTCGVVYNAKSHYVLKSLYAPPMAPSTFTPHRPAPSRPPAPPPLRPGPPPRPPQEEYDVEVFPGGFARFSLPVLKQATNNFSDDNKIGSGGFSSVYKGALYDGREVAIKILNNGYSSADNMCVNELTVGTKLKHKNVVSLVGYCIDLRMVFIEYEGKPMMAEERINCLVLGYISNKSLEGIVKGTIGPIDWYSCFKIIQEIAQGVHYIHEQRVIHLDLKPSNVLFNSDMDPVIIDFGLSKALEQGENKIRLESSVGTLGYIAPEQLSDQVVSFMSDVYSFGITLLRTLISLDHDAIKNFNSTNSASGPWYIGDHWERILEKAGGLKGLLNPAIEVYQSQLTDVSRCVEVGRLCAEPDRGDRPSMAEVVDMLSGKMELPAPKKKEKLVSKKAERSVTKKVERTVSKILGGSDSRT